MRPEHIQAFELAFIEGKNNKEIAAIVGRTSYTIGEWRKSPWWQFMEELWFSEKQQAFVKKLVEHDEDLNTAVGEIINGKRKDDRSVMAVVNIMDKRMKMGSKPIIEQKSGVTIDNRTINNKGTININRAIESMNSEEMLEMIHSGVIPDKVRGE